MSRIPSPFPGERSSPSGWRRWLGLDFKVAEAAPAAGDLLYGRTAEGEPRAFDIGDLPGGGGGGGAVDSVFGRTGAVVAATGDYDAAEVDFTPAGGIAASNVQAAIEELDAEKLGKAGGTMTGFVTLHADPDAAMKAATKQYVDQIVAAQDAMVFKGVVDCSANPNYPAADRGDTYRVSVAGKIGGGSGVNVEAGDLLLCLADATASGNQATVGSSWSIAQANLDGAVIGPASATDSHFAQFDGTTGKLLKGGKAAPAGTVVGTTDTQTLTNKAFGDLLDISAAAAGQIRFPATQNASADANTLDDYEEGTFTPGLTFGGGATGITYNAGNAARYTRIGRLVAIEYRLWLTSKGSSTGSAALTGLPFAAANDYANFSLNPIANMTSGVGDTYLSANTLSGLTTITPRKVSGGSAVVMTHADFANTSLLDVCGSYSV